MTRIFLLLAVLPAPHFLPEPQFLPEPHFTVSTPAPTLVQAISGPKTDVRNGLARTIIPLQAPVGAGAETEMDAGGGHWEDRQVPAGLFGRRVRTVQVWIEDGAVRRDGGDGALLPPADDGEGTRPPASPDCPAGPTTQACPQCQDAPHPGAM